MKKNICLALVLCCVLILTACGNATHNFAETDNKSNSNKSASREKMAEESFTAAVNSDNVENAAQYFETDSDEKLKDILNYFNQYEFTIEMDYLGKVDEMDAFKCKVILSDNSTLSSTFVFGKEKDGRYVFCEKESYLSEIKEKVLCNTCSASGVIYSGGTVCGICAGTGWQYIPNAYYDVGLHQWMGQNQVCSGCAGAGYFNRQTHTCNVCHGIGLILD